jgi:DNA adenine methylase
MITAQENTTNYMISYIGGKSTISTALIIPNIPKDIEIFCECFSGMMWTLFKMDLSEYPNLKKIVYNDFNPLNANLFRCVRNHKDLLDACNMLLVQQKGLIPTPTECKDMFDSFQLEIFEPRFIVPVEPDYNLAAKYAYVLTQVFSGSNPSRSKFIDLKGKYHSKFTSFKNKLSDPRWQRLFESITDVENMDFEEVIKKYDGPGTYIYADPPYYLTEKYYANHEFGIETHERLANCLKSIEGKFSLSYYDFPQLSEWFPKDEYRWTSKDFHKAAAAKSGQAQTKGTEILIMNYGKN